MIEAPSKPLTAFQRSMDVNVRFMEKIKSFGMRCHPAANGLAIVDEKLPKTCHQYTGITVSEDDIPQSCEYDLLRAFPQIAQYLRSGRKKALTSHRKRQQEAREFIKSLFS